MAIDRTGNGATPRPMRGQMGSLFQWEGGRGDFGDGALSLTAEEMKREKRTKERIEEEMNVRALSGLRRCARIRVYIGSLPHHRLCVRINRSAPSSAAMSLT